MSATPVAPVASSSSTPVAAMGSTWALHGAPLSQTAAAHGDASNQGMLPWEVFTHLLTFKDANYEMAFVEGTPSARRINDLNFGMIGDYTIIRPRETGTLYFITHSKVYPRCISLCFDPRRLR